MTVKDGKIVRATENELFSEYLRRGFDDLLSFNEYKERMVASGVVVVEKTEDIIIRNFIGFYFRSEDGIPALREAHDISGVGCITLNGVSFKRCGKVDRETDPC